MRHFFIALLLFTLAAPGHAASFQSWFPPKGERIWVGAGMWANRLQDWKVSNGRLECIERSASKPLRTVHLLTHRADLPGGWFEMSVTTGRLGDLAKPSEGAASGFLIGAGGSVDYRAAALVHHTPGPGAGILAGVDVYGNAFFHDLEKGMFRTPAEKQKPVRGWKVVSSDSEEKGSPASNAIDGNPTTIWHTEWQKVKPKHPHEIVIDLGKVEDIKGVTYLPRKGNTAGRIKDYELYVGTDMEWDEPVATGEFPDGEKKQVVELEPTKVRYIRWVALSAQQERPSTTVAELGILPVKAVKETYKKVPAQLSLYLTAIKAETGYSLTLTALDPVTTEVVSQATLDEVEEKRVVGNLALVSHPGKGNTESFWFRDWSAEGNKISFHSDRTGGPILCTQHTLHNRVMKMTAQLMPVGGWDGRNVRLQILQDGHWTDAGNSPIIAPGWTATFRIVGWRSDEDIPYRVIYQTRGTGGHLVTYMRGGVIRKDPVEKKEIVIAGFTGNHNTRGGVDNGRRYDWNENGLWFPHNDIVANVAKQEPDVLFFSGDQVYEGGSPTGPVKGRGLTTQLDYLYKWYLWCWAYGDLTRNVPTITIPDDHDVYQPNIWGQGGRPAKRDHEGGYVESPEFVKMVERTQTSHLPDPLDPTPIDQGIGVYYSPMTYGRIGFAILEDRKFKTGPKGVVPPTDTGRPDHVNDPNFDPKTADVPGANLLGDRQLKFLNDWAVDWTGTDMKIAVSQTIFAGMATHHGSGLNYLLADYDSNGWPQTGRNKALAALRSGFAFMLGGDQHLATIVQHGIDEHDDAGWSFCVPSIANFYPRAWMPKEQRVGEDWPEGLPSFTGRYHDGLGNKVTVYAATNPGEKTGVEPAALHDRMPGYGIVRMNKDARTITMECWPRYADPKNGGQQYEGWPKTIDQTSNYGREAKSWLPEIKVTGIKDPVVQVRNNDNGEILYTLRIKGTKFRPWTFKPGHYDIIVGDPDYQLIDGRQRIRSFPENDLKMTFKFKKPKRR